VDPDVNVFRLLYPEEIPAVVNSVKGSQRLVAVVSDGSPPETLKAFELLLAGLGRADAPIMSEKEAEMKMSEERDFLFLGLPRSEKLKSFFSASPENVILNSEKFSVRGFSGADCLFLAFADPGRGGGITALFFAGFRDRCRLGPDGGPQDHPLREVQLPRVLARANPGKRGVGSFALTS